MMSTCVVAEPSGERAADLAGGGSGEPTVVWLGGEHDITTAFTLADTLADAIGRGQDVTVDLSAVTFMGGTAIGVLVRAERILSDRSRALRLRAPSACARRLIDVCGLTGLVGEV